jgi:Fur family ferric uptake transcriptional regulator
LKKRIFYRDLDTEYSHWYLLIVTIPIIGGGVHSKSRLRLTKQRNAILDELRSTRNHPGANEVYHRVRKRLPNISLATVYRNLEILSEFGMISKLELAGTRKRFDGFAENHYHVRCTECDRVDDVPLDPIPTIDGSVGALVDYEIRSHRLEFVGVCPRCRKREHIGESQGPETVNGLRRAGAEKRGV